MKTRVMSRVLGLVGLGVLVSAGGCAEEFDSTHKAPARASIGEELFGVICDRVGAHSLREDLTGVSFRYICHRKPDGTFADTVDASRLPAAYVPGGVNVAGKPVSREAQEAQRARSIGRVEALATRRAALIAAFDALVPDILVDVRDTGAADPSLSCAPKTGTGSQRTLGREMEDLLARMQDLYLDDTVPQSTQSIARIMTGFLTSDKAQSAYAFMEARQGYRPAPLDFGGARPALAYPGLRDLSNTALRMLAADSDPYNPSPPLDAYGRRIPVPGAAYPQLSKLLEVAHEELRDMTADPPDALLVPALDAAGKYAIARPRSTPEFLSGLLSAEDDAFGSGTARYIVKRDARGVALVRPSGGTKVPSPFVDKDGDGVPDLDELGRFVTSDGTPAPTPFFTSLRPGGTYDSVTGRALRSGSSTPMYETINLSRTAAAAVHRDLRALVDVDAGKEPLMDALAGAYVLYGRRSSISSTRSYSSDPSRREDFELLYPGQPVPTSIDQVSVEYKPFETANSALLDLVYAAGQVLGDSGTDTTLALVQKLFREHDAALARVIGAALYAKTNIADKHDEAKIPATATFWDEVLDVVARISRVPGLLEAVLTSMTDDRAGKLGEILGSYQDLKDHISYDRNNINGPPMNVTTAVAGGDMKTKIDRTKPLTGWNRSAMQRFLQVVHDTNNLTLCNKEGAKAYVVVPDLGNLEMTIPSSLVNAAMSANDKKLLTSDKEGFKECAIFKIDNAAAFYLRSFIGEAAFYFRPKTFREGILSMGAANNDMIEQSSGLSGTWGGPSSKTVRPRPQFLDRMVFFDYKRDTKNERPYKFLSGLQGTIVPSSVCPERIISDPCLSGGINICDEGDNAKDDVAADGKVRLRSCAAGDDIYTRSEDATFVWEKFGFFDAFSPMIKAFADADQDALLLELLEVLHKHWGNKDLTEAECKLSTSGNAIVSCARTGLVTYEPLSVELFASDVWKSLVNLMKAIEPVKVDACTAVDQKTLACTKTQSKSAISVLADATRFLVDPEKARAIGLTDRRGKKTTARNDGSSVGQVTPVYLLLDALNGIDKAFADYAKDNPSDTERQAKWKAARSSLVDVFLDVDRKNTTSASFHNKAVPKLVPVLLDLTRAQLAARCPTSFVSPYQPCTWARETLTKKLQGVLEGPTFASSVDVLEALRRDDDARKEVQRALAWMLDPSSDGGDAFASLLATVVDLPQVAQDETRIVPVVQAFGDVTRRPLVRDDGRVLRRSALDAQFALLSRIAGKAYTKSGAQNCAKELDPNQVLSIVLDRALRPMVASDGTLVEAPMAFILDAIAEVNRELPAAGTPAKLAPADYGKIAAEVYDFLMNKERGLEQLYEIVRQGAVQ